MAIEQAAVVFETKAQVRERGKGDRQFKAVGDQGWAGLGRLRLGFGARSEAVRRKKAAAAAFGPVGQTRRDTAGGHFSVYGYIT